MNVYLPNLRLPSAYQEVEYIQSSGTNGSSGQYINTGIIPESANTVVKLRTMPTSSSYSIYLCSCMVYKGTGQTNYYYGLSFTANRWHCGYGTPGSSGSGKALIDFSYTWNWGNTIYDVEYRNDDLYVNNTLVANATTNVSNFQYPMFLFARNNDGTAGVFSSFKLYSCEIYKSGTLVRDFVPCYRKSDNVIGLYDLVNNQFYTNSGTGTFSKGNDVTMAELKNAYIGEVYEYSYDFTNKSTTAMENDGWTFILNKSYASFGNDGVYVNVNNGTTMFKREVISSIMPNAKKVTLTFTNKTNFGGSDLRLYRVATSSTRSDVTGSHFQVGNSSSECYVQTNIYGSSTNTAQIQSDYLGKWYTQTCVIDLENLKMTTSNTTGFYKEQTLTQTQANNIKNNSIGYYCGLANNTSGNYTYLKSINVIIEK